MCFCSAFLLGLSMDESTATPTGATVIFELALGGLGLAVAYAAGFWNPPTFFTVGAPFHTTSFGDAFLAITSGFLWTVPMLALIGIVQLLPLRSIRELSSLVDEQLIPMFKGKDVLALALTAASAGIGEEILFRWTIQTGFSEGLDTAYAAVWGIAVASMVFGLMHWLTPAYAVIATLISIYLGIQLLVTESLLSVIVTHGVYDFVMLVYLVKYRAHRIPQTAVPKDSK